MRTWLVFGALVLAGCAKVDKPVLTDFTPTPSGFTYKATAGAGMAADSAKGEQWRIQMLEEYLRDNGVCPGGYTIVDRREILVTTGVLADIVDITYQGACK